MNEEKRYDGTTLLETPRFRYRSGRTDDQRQQGNELVLTFSITDDLDRRTRVIHDYLTLTAMRTSTTLKRIRRSTTADPSGLTIA